MDGQASNAACSEQTPSLLQALGSLPCVSEAIHAVSTFDIGPVTALLEKAAYFPLLLSTSCREGSDGFRAEAQLDRFALVTSDAGGRLTGENRAGGAAATVSVGWRLVPEGYVGHPGQLPPVPVIPHDPRTSQRFEVFEWELRFRGGADGFRAYGTGRTLPQARVTGPGGPATVGAAFVLDLTEGWGALAGLAGTVVASGAIEPGGVLALGVMTRVMDPAGGLLASAPLPPLPPGAGPEPGVTYLTFLGEVDPAHPVTLRLSLTEGILGSNVYERLLAAGLDCDAGAGRLASRTEKGRAVGSVAARLSFNPLALCGLTPIQTRCGVFQLQDGEGRSLGTVEADMIEGRSFRSSLPGMLLPVFRFGGFGPILGGSGEFAGATGIMSMNSVVSVQPRTLANSYVLRLEDPDGRYRALAGAARASAITGGAATASVAWGGGLAGGPWP